MTTGTTSENRVVYGSILVFGVAAIWTLARRFELQSSEAAYVSIIGNAAYLGVGSLLMFRRPGNAVGRVLIGIGLIWNISTAVAAEAEAMAAAGNLDLAAWLSIGSSTLVPIGLWLFVLLILLFPKGHSSSKGAERLLSTSLIYAAVLTLVVFLTPPSAPSLTNENGDPISHPIVGDAVSDFAGGAPEALMLPLMVMMLIAAVILIARMRRSGPIERRQIALVTYAFAIYSGLAAVNITLEPFGEIGSTGFALFDLVGFALIPTAIGVAILKHSLFDIDVVISKSVTYLGLLAVITALYAAVVVGPLLVIGRTDDGEPGLVLPIIATAVVAVLFEPIQSRMQRWANRLVYGTRSTPHDVLSQVTARLSEGTGRNGTDNLARLLAEGTGAIQAVVWVTDDNRLRPEGLWSGDASTPMMPLTAESLVADECTDFAPIQHEDQQLGALSITKGQNDPITPADRELLADVAAGAGLLLRNLLLNQQLKVRAEEVRESRRRLVAAQDNERHRLERDLHDGAQQQVVALKVKLGIAKTLAQRERADEIVTIVLGLAEKTQGAVDALRAVAHGIYPPLLESEGLEPALRAVKRSSPFPVALDVAITERYTRSIEETVYFCVVETLERVRMSGAAGASVDLVSRNGELVMEFDLRDRTTEIDLTAVSDRLDAAGGTLTIDEIPDSQNLRIAGSLPSTAMAMEMA